MSDQSNIADCLTEHAIKRPDHPAVIDGERVMTYAQLDRLVDEASVNLEASGIQPGDVVGVALPDTPEYLITLLALARCGAVILAIDGALPTIEKQRAATSTRVKAVIAAERALAVEGVALIDAASLSRPVRTVFRPPALADHHPLMIAQSSGTTGAPKSLAWSHAQMRKQVQRHRDCLRWTAQDRHLTVVSMRFFWERELCFVLFCLGATVFVHRGGSVAALVQRVNTSNITILALTPAHLGPLLKHPSEQFPLFPSVKTMIVGSAPLTHERRLLVRQRLTPNFFEQLGSNEAGLLVLGSPADQDARPDAIGRVVRGVEARVVDSYWQPIPAGQVGLVGFRGEDFPTEYIDDPEATARYFREGWYYPGDLATIDADGYFLFKGRSDDVINSAGVKFYPIELEKVLLTHPAVSEAAVFGWPDPKLGEVAVAFVTSSSDAQTADLEGHCRSRLAGHKIPSWIVFIAHMPKTSSGKILKRRLKEIFGGHVTGRRE